MDRLEFLTDFLNGFSEDTLHLVGLGLGLLGTIVGIWAKIAQIRHKKKTRVETTRNNEIMVAMQKELATLKEEENTQRSDANQLKLAEVQLEHEKAGRIKIDPHLQYREHDTAAGKFLTLRVGLTQHGPARVLVTKLNIKVEVLRVIDSDLRLNGKESLELDFTLDNDDTRIDSLTFIPESRFWEGLIGFYEFGRSKDIDIPLQTEGTGLFSAKINLTACAVHEDNSFVDEAAWEAGGETLVGSIG